MTWPRLLIFLVLLASPLTRCLSQSDPLELFALPRRVMSLEQALIELTQAGAELSYRPDLLPEVPLRIPGGQRTLERWLEVLLRDTELTYERGAAGYLVFPNPDILNQPFNLFGMVTDRRTGERLIGATVQVSDRGIGTQSNEYGFYTLPTTGGRQHLRVTYVGYAPFEQELLLRSDSLINLRLVPNRELPQIIVTATNADQRSSGYLDTGTQIGREEVAQLGGPGGEADPLQLARLLSGVTSGADGIGGIFIRGSEAGHNLILLDGVPVYGLSHAGGLFSIFSNQAIRRMDLYKDAIPARFGGRIGGVLDVHTRDGNLYENEYTIGSSLLSSQIAAEGPIKNGESSFLLTGRYFWAGKLIRNYSETYKANRGRRGFTDYDVYDVNFKLNQRAGERGRVYLSLYSGLDNYMNTTWYADTITQINAAGAMFINAAPTSRAEHVRWGNTVGALRYNHVFNDRTFGNFRLSYSDLVTESSFERYDSLIEVTNGIVSGNIFSGSYASKIRQFGVAFDAQYSTALNSFFRFGLEADLHQFDPQLLNGSEKLASYELEQEVAAHDTHLPVQLTSYGSYNGNYRQVYYRIGFRSSLWRNQGRSYYNLSPRLLLAGPLTENADWQLSYDRTVQPIHLLNSFVIGLPSDLWVPSTPDIAPATAQQLSAKYKLRPRTDWNFETSVYYKSMHNLVSYPEGLQSRVNWIENLSNGRGRAYGLETSIQRSRGKLRGWLSYTLAKSDRTYDERINLGRTYPFRYDRRHAVNLLLIYQLGERTTLTGSWRYETGLAYSLSLETIPDPQMPGPGVPFTSERNGFRMPANHRFDLNLHTKLGSANGKLTHSIDVGLYNAYNRHNPIYYETRPDYYVNDGELIRETTFYKIFVAPLLPSLSYQLIFSGGNRSDFGK